jgi:hypothetical protein
MKVAMSGYALAVLAQAALECRHYIESVARAVMIMQVATLEVIPPEGGEQGMST